MKIIAHILPAQCDPELDGGSCTLAEEHASSWLVCWYDSEGGVDKLSFVLGTVCTGFVETLERIILGTRMFSGRWYVVGCLRGGRSASWNGFVNHEIHADRTPKNGFLPILSPRAVAACRLSCSKGPVPDHWVVIQHFAPDRDSTSLRVFRSHRRDLAILVPGSTAKRRHAPWPWTHLK